MYVLYKVGPTDAKGGRPFTVKCGEAIISGFFIMPNGWIVWPKKPNGDHLIRMSTGTRQRVSMSLKRQIADLEQREPTKRERSDPRAEYDKLVDRWNSDRQWETEADMDRCIRRIHELETQLNVPIEDRAG